MTKPHEKMLRTQRKEKEGKRIRRGEQRQREEVGEGDRELGDPFPPTQEDRHQITHRSPEPKLSNHRCSKNIFRVNIYRGDISGLCSQWK